MAQRYGLEIECFGLDTAELRAAIESVNGLNYGGHFHYHGSRTLGLRCSENGNGNVWVSEDDSSLTNTAGRGFCHEVISPVMEGEAGLRTVGKVMTALSRAGAKVNRSCGLHTTFGIENSSARFRRMSAKKKAQRICAIVDAYDYFMAGFDSLVSPSRRFYEGRASSYASAIRYPHGTSNAFGLQTAEDAQTIVERGVGRGYLNIGSFLSKGIIEFRQHNGTLSRWKIYNWSLLLQRLVQWALNDRHTNHGCDVRNFAPTLHGLIEMLDCGSDLTTALLARADELQGVLPMNTTYHYDARMTEHEDFIMRRDLPAAAVAAIDAAEENGRWVVVEGVDA